MTSLKDINTKNDAARYLDRRTDVSKTRPTEAQLRREARVLVAEVKALEKSNSVPPRKLVSLLVRITKYAKKILKIVAVMYASGITYIASYNIYRASLNQMCLGLKAISGKTAKGTKLVTGPVHLVIGVAMIVLFKALGNLADRMVRSQFTRTLPRAPLRTKKTTASKTPRSRRATRPTRK